VNQDSLDRWLPTLTRYLGFIMAVVLFVFLTLGHWEALPGFVPAAGPVGVRVGPQRREAERTRVKRKGDDRPFHYDGPMQKAQRPIRWLAATWRPDVCARVLVAAVREVGRPPPRLHRHHRHPDVGRDPVAAMSELEHDDHQGPPGPPGEKGTFPKEVTRAFVFVIAIAFLILLFVAFQAKRSNDVAAQSRRTALQAKAVASTVRQQAATIAQLRQAQLASCKNFETLKNAVNEFHGTIKSVLKAAEARAAAAENDPHTVAAGEGVVTAAVAGVPAVVGEHQDGEGDVRATSRRRRLERETDKVGDTTDAEVRDVPQDAP
jgi:hypothetical protein